MILSAFLGSLGGGELSLGITEGVLGVAEGGGEVVTLSFQGSLDGGQLADQPVGILKSLVGLTELIWKWEPFCLRYANARV